MNQNNRQSYNKQIVQKLLQLIEDNPDQRFTQLLVNCDIDTRLYNEESAITLAKVTNSPIANVVKE